MSFCKEFIPVIRENLPEILALRHIKQLKPDQSYVSEGDLYCERMVFGYFSRLGPTFTFISEEQAVGGRIRPGEDEFTVTIDPIDGTENFISGLKEWGIGISIYKGNSHYESMIALPELDEYLVTGDRITRTESRIYGLSSSLTREDLLQLEQGFEYRIIGCCMYNMLNVVKGSYRQFQNPKGAHSWDILPGLNLALEHGLEVTVENQRYYGEFLQPTEKYRFTVRNL